MPYRMISKRRRLLTSEIDSVTVVTVTRGIRTGSLRRLPDLDALIHSCFSSGRIGFCKHVPRCRSSRLVVEPGGAQGSRAFGALAMGAKSS